MTHQDILAGCDVWAGRGALSQAYCEAPDRSHHTFSLNRLYVGTLDAGEEIT